MLQLATFKSIKCKVKNKYKIIIIYKRKKILQANLHTMLQIIHGKAWINIIYFTAFSCPTGKHYRR